MKHWMHVALAAARHPRIALLGAREFRSGVGMTYDQHSRNDAYDAGREVAHAATFRRYDDTYAEVSR